MLDLLRDLIVTSAISVLVLILLASTIGGISSDRWIAPARGARRDIG